MNEEARRENGIEQKFHTQVAGTKTYNQTKGEHRGKSATARLMMWLYTSAAWLVLVRLVGTFPSLANKYITRSGHL